MRWSKVCAMFLLPAAFVFSTPDAMEFPVPHFPGSTQLEDDSLVWKNTPPKYGEVYTDEDFDASPVAPLPPARPQTAPKNDYNKTLPL